MRLALVLLTNVSKTFCSATPPRINHRGPRHTAPRCQSAAERLARPPRADRLPSIAAGDQPAFEHCVLPFMNRSRRPRRRAEPSALRFAAEMLLVLPLL